MYRQKYFLIIMKMNEVEKFKKHLMAFLVAISSQYDYRYDINELVTKHFERNHNFG